MERSGAPDGPPGRALVLEANRLRLHLLEWPGAAPPILLVHGFLEHAHAWDWVAPRLAAAGHRVLALDWRGHGDSEWIGPGGYYHFADYVADLAALIPQLASQVVLVGHSMGSNAALLYAGTQPERLHGLVLIDGLGLPDGDPTSAVLRYRQWLADLDRVRRRPTKSFDVDEAAALLRSRFPRFSDAVARHMAEHGSRAVNGTRRWKFDPLHQTQSPQPYYVAQARPFWEAVHCPVLFVRGSESDLLLPQADRSERLRLLDAREVVLPSVGHHPHLECPDALADTILGFLADSR